MLEKENKFPVPMNDMGEPQEMSPAADKSETPFIEVDQPIQSQDPLEIRDSSAVAGI